MVSLYTRLKERVSLPLNWIASASSSPSSSAVPPLSSHYQRVGVETTQVEVVEAESSFMIALDRHYLLLGQSDELDYLEISKFSRRDSDAYFSVESSEIVLSEFQEEK